MSIKITNAEETPALKYENFFLCELKMDQTIEHDNFAPPLYNLRVTYRLYAVDSDGRRHFTNKVDHIILDDYYAEAMAKAQSGDMDLAQAMGAIELALAQIIADQTDLGTAEVS